MNCEIVAVCVAKYLALFVECQFLIKGMSHVDCSFVSVELYLTQCVPGWFRNLPLGIQRLISFC